VIVRVAHTQRKGGTAVVVGIGLWLMAYGSADHLPYPPANVCSNQTVLIEGVRKFTNEQIVHMLGVMVKEHLTDRVFLLAEADRTFPPRSWQDKKQTAALIGVQQDEKMGNCIVYDSHLRGVDVLLDSATQIEIVCEYRPRLDCIDCEVTWLHDMIPCTPMRINNVSKKIFPYYWTHEPVI